MSLEQDLSGVEEKLALSLQQQQIYSDISYGYISLFSISTLIAKKKLFPSTLMLVCLRQRHSSSNIEHPERLAPGGKRRREKEKKKSQCAAAFSFSVIESLKRGPFFFISPGPQDL